MKLVTTSPPTWTASTLILDETYRVELYRHGNLVAELAPEDAEDLADALRDAAAEPPTCEKPSCGLLAIDRGLCSWHTEVAW